MRQHMDVSQMVRSLGAAALIAVMLAATGAAPASAADKPTDYRVTLTQTPSVTVNVADLSIDNLDAVQKYCTLPGFPPAVGVPFPCVNFPIAVADAGIAAVGTARNASNGRTGTFVLNCDFVFPATSSVTVSLPEDYRPKPEDVTLDAVSGKGPMGCSWAIVFGSSGSVSGTAKGTVSIARVPNEQRIAASVNVTIKVTAGSGPYAVAVGGGGSYADRYAAPFTPATAAAATARSARAAAAPPLGTLRLTLGHSRSQAAIVPLPATLRSEDPQRLRVVAPKGSRCTAAATLGSRKVSLGRANVTQTGGEATFPSTIRKKLTRPGAWKISAACTAAKKKLTATTTARIG